jgi:hypothetical protein
VLFDRRITLSQLPHVRRIKVLLFQVVTEGPLVYRWRAPGCNNSWLAWGRGMRSFPRNHAKHQVIEAGRGFG